MSVGWIVLTYNNPDGYGSRDGWQPDWDGKLHDNITAARAVREEMVNRDLSVIVRCEFEEGDFCDFCYEPQTMHTESEWHSCQLDMRARQTTRTGLGITPDAIRSVDVHKLDRWSKGG